jgi:uncharacterized protein (DUF427 family)
LEPDPNHFVVNKQASFPHQPKFVTMKKQALWNGVVLAESDDLVQVEGNYYFPSESLNKSYFESSDTHTTCPWKGLASYFTLQVAGKQNKDAAWYYPSPKEAAREITGRVAFWKGVEIVDA